MAYLPLANILHRKLRSILSAAGIGIGMCMLLTLTGLSRGSLSEVADRWEAVDAELILCPRGIRENVTAISGPPALSDRLVARIESNFAHAVREVVPVLLCTLKLQGSDYLSAGVDPAQWRTLTGGRPLSEGRLPDPNGDFARWLEHKVLSPAEDAPDGQTLSISNEELGAHGGLELVVDDRLAHKAHLRVGDSVESAGCRWRIVGVVLAGGMTRVYMPRRTAQFLFGNGLLKESTIFFVKLRGGLDPLAAAREIRSLGQDVMPVSQYRGLLQQKFGIMYVYVDIVNAIALVISFLFIMVTLYTLVLQRTREIAILRSLGATGGYVMRGVLAEAMLITAGGTAGGIVLSFVAAWLIQTLTLYSVTITLPWVGVALAAAAAGAVLAGLYPAWRATKVDVVETLTLE